MCRVHPTVQLTNSSRHLCIPRLLEAQAERTPNAIAITAPGLPPLTYSRLWMHIDDVVKTLHATGVDSNDRVALVLPSGPEMAVAFLAIAASATCAPLNPGYHTNEFDFYLSDLNAKLLILQSGMDSPARAVAQARGIPILELSPVCEAEAGIFTLRGYEWVSRTVRHGFAQPNDVALVLHTSGTTSRPKMVPLTHMNLCTSAGNNRVAFKLAASDRCLHMMPLFHISGLMMVLSSLLAGASVVCPPGLYAPRFFEWMKDFHPTWYMAAPAMHQAILVHAALHRDIIERCPLRFIRSGSAPLPLQVLAELERVFNVPVMDSYGLTETTALITSNPLPPREQKAGSVGVTAGPEVAIMDEAGNLLPPGVIGEIVTRGATITQSYENNLTANQSAFMHGWFRTGDQGFLDPDDYLFITGRLKEIINRGGEKISPREVDEVLLEHPAITQAVTFAVPHPSLGEDVAAAVILREHAAVTEREIRAFAAARLAAFKVPCQVVIVEEIPKGTTGKLQRIGLAEKLGLGSNQERLKLDRDFVAPRDTVELQLTQMWEKLLAVTPISVTANFFALGGNSLLAEELLVDIKKRFGKTLSPATLFQAPTVEQIARLIRQAGCAAPPSLVVPLQSRGTQPPFFCHGISFDLAGHLGADQPVYGLHPHGQDGRRAPATVEEMAASYLKEIRTFQPEGPYYLGGYSFGGLVAFEMAQQLYQQGQQVALLVLLDPTSPGASVALPSAPGRPHRDQQVHPLARLGLRMKPTWVLEAMQWKLDRFKRQLKMLACRLSLGMGRCVPPVLRMFYFFEVSRQAVRAYSPPIYPGRIIFVQAERSPLAWRGLATEGLEIHTVPGHHLDLLREPHAQVVGETLQACLENAHRMDRTRHGI